MNSNVVIVSIFLKKTCPNHRSERINLTSGTFAEHMKPIALILFTILVPMTMLAEAKVKYGKGEEQKE